MTDSTADGGTDDNGGVETFEAAFEIAGADNDVGNSNVTRFGSGVASFFCSSMRFRSLFMASASSSCFSHFEYDFECFKRGRSPVDTRNIAGPAETRRPKFAEEGCSNGLTLRLTFVTIESLKSDFDPENVRLGDCQRSCFPTAIGDSCLRISPWCGHLWKNVHTTSFFTTSKASSFGEKISPRSSSSLYSSSSSHFSIKTIICACVSGC